MSQLNKDMKLFKWIKVKFSKPLKTESVIEQWEKSGKPLPPPHEIKQRVISDFQKMSGLQLFIETGTFMGDMVAAQRSNFKKIYSIELGEQLFRDATERFKDDRHIHILQGDSSDVLPDILTEVIEPAVFWLDGHYSSGITALGKKECPIYEELTAIFNAPPFAHILLIDDARLFTGANDYPTRGALSTFINKHRPTASIEIKDDIIQVFI
jgi:hypothetical protein